MGAERVLRSDPEIHLLATAATGAEGLRLTESLCPDVVVVDHVIPDVGALEVCRRTVRCGANVLILSGDLGDAAVAVSLRAGARGFVHLGIDGLALKAAVRAVGRGEAVLDPAVSRGTVGAFEDKPAGRGHGLSVREVEVLRMVARGFADRHIASQIGVSPNTVKTYIRRAVSKLRCRNRTEAAAMVARLGLVDGNARLAGRGPRASRAVWRAPRRPSGSAYRASYRPDEGTS